MYITDSYLRHSTEIKFSHRARSARPPFLYSLTLLLPCPPHVHLPLYIYTESWTCPPHVRRTRRFHTEHDVRDIAYQAKK